MNPLTPYQEVEAYYSALAILRNNIPGVHHATRQEVATRIATQYSTAADADPRGNIRWFNIVDRAQRAIDAAYALNQTGAITGTYPTIPGLTTTVASYQYTVIVETIDSGTGTTVSTLIQIQSDTILSTSEIERLAVQQARVRVSPPSLRSVFADAENLIDVRIIGAGRAGDR